MIRMIEQTLDFFAEKARGLLLTLVGTGLGSAAKALGDSNIIPTEVNTLDDLQRWVFIASLVVASLTTISYLYKFYQWCKSKFRKK